jgi:hypothetical protein
MVEKSAGALCLLLLYPFLLLPKATIISENKKIVIKNNS